MPAPRGCGMGMAWPPLVPLNMLRKWMGHASIETTAIYANAVGAEEQQIAACACGARNM